MTAPDTPVPAPASPAAPIRADIAAWFAGAVILAPLTRGGNLPYRRLCVELGARVTVSEMTVARRLKQKRRGEYALIRRASDEPCFGVQLAGTNPEEMGWAAGLVESRGADFADLNAGCPIDVFTRRGLGAALSRQPNRIRRIVECMARGVQAMPITVKIRLGWNESSRNHVDQARAAVDGGAAAIIVHGRTRDARYRLDADWDSVGEVVAAVPVPVIGNGDLLFPHQIEAARTRSGCAGVMTGRGALIKPWLFREATAGYWDITPDERVALYRRYVTLAREHWGGDDHGTLRVREFTRWHLGFWCRYVPQRADGSWPGMQERSDASFARSPLEHLLARGDDAALDWLADRLVTGDPIEPADVPGPSAAGVKDLEESEG